MKPIRKIAVLVPFKPFFGATLVQFPLYQHLRANYPEAHICLWAAITCPHAKLVQQHGLADEVKFYNRKSKIERLKLLGELNRYKADVLINLRPWSDISVIIGAMSNARYKIGFKPVAPLFDKAYFGSVPFNFTQYIAFNYLDMLKLLPNASELQYFGFDHVVKMGEAEPSFLQKGAHYPAVCLMPGGGEGPHKRWSIENYCKLCFLIQESHPDAYFVFVLGGKEEEYIPYIKEHMLEGSYEVCLNPSLPQLSRLIQDVQLSVANDCGPSHFAQMIEGYYIGIWGWQTHANPCPYTRIAQWHHIQENSWPVVPKQEDHNINTIQPEAVVRLARMALEDQVIKK